MSKLNVLVIFSIGLLIAISGTAYVIKQPVKIASQANTEKQMVKSLSLHGSNTVGETFAPRLAKAYLKTLGAINIKTIPQHSSVEKIIQGTIPSDNTLIQIEIRAHGSSTGFTALSENQTDIAMSSRKIKGKEYDELLQKYQNVSGHPIALDALAIVTYPTNPVNSLTSEQVAAIFSGQATNWSEFGGENRSISLYSRDNNSGTWDTFKSLVLKPRNLTLSEKSARFESSANLVKGVINNKGALGFVGVAHVGSSKVLAIAKSNTNPSSLPNGYTIGTQAYPLSRTLFLYTKGVNQSEIVKSFIDFVSRNDGQKEAEDAGLVSYYPSHYRPKDLPKNTPLRYRELASMASRITVNFGTNSDNVDTNKEQRDLTRLRNYVEQNPNQSLVLVDFSRSERLAELKDNLSQNQVEVFDTLSIEHPPFSEGDIEVWIF